jgi:HK97 family phage prohead protease
MPLPKPKKDESKDEFMDRCMSDSVMKKEYPDNDQRYAVCESQWDESKKSRENPNNIERRILSFDNTELRAEADEPKITGYAAKFGTFTDLGYFREKIKAGAFDDVLDDDVRCLKNHDPNLILGRTKNETLRVASNSVGLKFNNDMPDTNTGRDTLEEIRRGDISGCSFAFIVAEDEWKYYDDDRPAERTIIKISRLFDVGPVTYPAYEDTTVSARSLEMAKKTDGFLSSNEIRKDEERKKKYECECIDCGHTIKTDKHCKDIKCSECGGQMRRKERPGPGQKSADEGEETKDEMTFEQNFEYQRNVRKAERLKLRLESSKQAEA